MQQQNYGFSIVLFFDKLLSKTSNSSKILISCHHLSFCNGRMSLRILHNDRYQIQVKRKTALCQVKRRIHDRKFQFHCKLKYYPIAETALKAIGLTAFPLIPPQVVLFSTPMAGQASPFVLRPIKPDTVLIAVTPSAPPS